MTISLPALVMIGFGLFWLGGAVALWVFAFCTRGGKALSCINCERDAQFCRGCCDAISPTPSAPVVDAMEALRIAHGHLDMAALRVSHCNDARKIESALSGVSAHVGVEDLVAAAKAVQRAARGEREPWDRLNAAIEQVETTLTPPAAAPTQEKA